MNCEDISSDSVSLKIVQTLKGLRQCIAMFDCEVVSDSIQRVVEEYGVRGRIMMIGPVDTR